jgi:hypothetical protein
MRGLRLARSLHQPCEFRAETRAAQKRRRVVAPHLTVARAVVQGEAEASGARLGFPVTLLLQK